MTKAHPYSGWDRKSMYSQFFEHMHVQGRVGLYPRTEVWRYNKITELFYFQLIVGLCLRWKRRKEELFWRGFYGCNSPKVSYSS